MPFLIVWSFLVLSFSSFAQKRAIEHADFEQWNNIIGTQISNNGSWVAYHLKPLKGDQILLLHQAHKSIQRRFVRAENTRFTDDSRHLVFRQKIAIDFESIAPTKNKKRKMAQRYLGNS